MSRSAQSSITIDQFIRAVGGDTVKSADDATGGNQTVKSADSPRSEPGSIGGATTHPIKSVDDHLIEAKEGARSAENTKDVKKEVPASVDATPEAKAKTAASIFDVVGRHTKKAEGAVSTPGSAEADSLQIGTKKAPTGEDPKSETSSAKAGKEDKREGERGGTEHPASTENSSLDGSKYAFDVNTPLEKLASHMAELGNTLCAELAWDARHAGAEKTAEAAQAHAGTKVAAAPVTTEPAVKQAVDPYLAQQLGYELAGLITNPDSFDKKAADALVYNSIAEIIKEASDDADAYIACADQFFKAAAGEPGGGEAGGGGASGTSVPPPAEGGGDGGEEGAMMSALGGGADAGGAPPGGEGGGAGGAGGGEHMSTEQVLQLLEALGVTPDQIQQAMAQEGGGMGGEAGGAMGGAAGGMGGGMGGGEAGGMGGMGGGGEVPGAEAAMAGMAGGGGGAAAGGPPSAASPSMAPKAAADKAKSTTKVAATKASAANMRQYITELVSRSRNAK